MIQHRRWIQLLILFGAAIAISLGLAHVTSMNAEAPLYEVQTASVANIPSFTKNYAQQYVHYVTVACPNQRSVREMYINREAVTALQQGNELPDGTTIAMETRSATQQGNRLVATRLNNTFVRQKQAGQWQNAWYSASQSLVSDSQASCIGCHARVRDRDYVFTQPALKAAAKTGQKQSQITEFSTSVCR